MNWLVFLLFLFGFFISCSPISKNLRDLADRSLTFEEALKNPEAYKGKIVIWGGEIIETLNQKDNTTLIEVLQKPLNWVKEPKETKESGGRFLALVEKFLDPHIYRKDREVTIAGEVLGVKKRLLGELEYPYPLILGKQSMCGGRTNIITSLPITIIISLSTHGGTMFMIVSGGMTMLSGGVTLIGGIGWVST